MGQWVPPVIDIEPLGADVSNSGADAVIRAIDAACTSTGFFVAVGHGIDAELSAALDGGRRFFGQPQSAKEATPRHERYGYVPHRSSALDPDRASDLTEYIDLGLGDEVAMPALEGFEQTTRGYQQSALDVAHRLMAAIAVALGSPPTFFAERMGSPQCRLRFLHYPPTPRDADGALPVLSSTHTDYGGITLLATDGVPGLEVLPIGGEWTPVVAPEGALIVNLGDMLARWTNDFYASTPHRVLGAPDRDRYSMPFFVNPDPSTVVEVMPSCATAERAARYAPVTAGEFLAMRIDSSAEPYVDPLDGPRRYEP